MIRTSILALACCICLAPAPALFAQGTAAAPDGPVGGLNYDPQTGTFTPVQPPDGGWQGLARLLERAAPATDTSVPLSAAQFSAHVARLVDQGQAGEALELIQLRRQGLDPHQAVGTDVQLRYQQGRALAALGQHPQAQAIWQQMTIDYPELPEPWNALAIEYVREGALQRAREALEMALVSDPDFAPALENLGHVQMQLAREAFARARAADQKAGRHGPGT
ncbi:hypothetical protein [Castellaniella sp.]|uniref:hypothetical protein n=1 Tax=Castellaniella sp. TaxID=1955812 RepID=UPI0035633E44